MASAIDQEIVEFSAWVKRGVDPSVNFAEVQRVLDTKVGQKLIREIVVNALMEQGKGVLHPAEAANPLRWHAFRMAYTTALTDAVIRAPDKYDYSTTEVPRVVVKMLPALAEGTAYISPVVKKAAKTLHIQPTAKGIQIFLGTSAGGTTSHPSPPEVEDETRAEALSPGDKVVFVRDSRLIPALPSGEQAQVAGVPAKASMNAEATFVNTAKDGGIIIRLRNGDVFWTTADAVKVSKSTAPPAARPPDDLGSSARAPMTPKIGPKDTTDPRVVGTLHLQDVGEYQAIPAGKIQTGDVLVWNTGSKSVVYSMGDVSPQFIMIVELYPDSYGKNWQLATKPRKLKKDRLVGFHSNTPDTGRRHEFLPVVVSGAPPHTDPFGYVWDKGFSKISVSPTAYRDTIEAVLRLLQREFDLDIGHSNPQALGCGQHACAFALPEFPQWVVKITGDPTEAAAWTIVLAERAKGNPVEGVARALAVFAFPMELPPYWAGDASVAAPARMYGVVVEKLVPLDKPPADTLEQYKGVLRIGSTPSEQFLGTIGRAYGEYGGKDVEGFKRRYLALVRTLARLRKIGVDVQDIKGDNVMMTLGSTPGVGDVAGEWRITDLGIASAPEVVIPEVTDIDLVGILNHATQSGGGVENLPLPDLDASACNPYKHSFAWISPEGELIPVENHDYWALQELWSDPNFDHDTEDARMTAAGETGRQASLELMKRGWLRAANAYSYQGRLRRERPEDSTWTSTSFNNEAAWKTAAQAAVECVVANRINPENMDAYSSNSRMTVTEFVERFGGRAMVEEMFERLEEAGGAGSSTVAMASWMADR